MTPEQEALQRSLLAHQEAMGASIARLANPDEMTRAARGVEDQGTPEIRHSAIGAATARMELARQLKKLETHEILQLFSLQARKRDAGTPLESWLANGGNPAQAGFEAMLQSRLDPTVTKAVDTSSVSALIRQDLEPFLYEVFVRMFPAYERIPKEPANGLVHAWNQITDYGDAQFMSELGTVTDDKSTYQRQTTNIAILATRRGISLKAAFAVPAGGMNYNPEQIELTSAMRALSHKMQKTIFGGNATDSGGAADNELGLYDPNGFTGLRTILNTANAVNVDPADTDDADSDIQLAVDAALEPVIQAGGTNVSIAYSHPHERRTLNAQQLEKTRIVLPDNTDIGVGVTVARVFTVAGAIPWATVVGDSIGDYDTTSSDGPFNGGETVRDIYLLNEDTITLPYLGSPGPTVLDIPVGVSGQLTRLFIVFLMNGLAVKVPSFNNKVRVKI